jgi:peptide methionine sulfoxide reductase MsrA
MSSVKKAAFAMGCFWGTEALFGVTKGVLRTKVGYAGGSSRNPTYRNLADHIETVELEFDEDQISYEVSFFSIFLKVNS